VTEPDAVAAAIRGAAERITKPMVATFLGMQGIRPQLGPVPAFGFPEGAATALAHVARYGEWLRKPVTSAEPLPDELRAKLHAVVDACCARGDGWLSPDACEALLETAGVPVLRSRTVRNADEAVVAAREVGLPAVLKAIGKDILHKSDVGGVRLGLASEQAIRDAFAALSAQLHDRLDAVLVQPMVSGGVEMVVGGLNDPGFGPVVMCGTGGVLVDLLDDTAFALCPLADADARTLVERLKGRVRMRGFRGAAAADEAAFRRLLVRVSQLLHACPEIQEMDLNPVMVLPAGAIVADVRIRLGSARAVASGRHIRH
jgi:acyl-CoA synthetase (NDP forming)